MPDGPVYDGMWKGRRAFIFGGGPSFTEEDAAHLAGEHSVGINMAFLRNPDITLAYDLRLMCRLESDPRWREYDGIRLWLNYEVARQQVNFQTVTMLRECMDEAGVRSVWSRRLRDGLYRGTHAGPAAINLADLLGADPIYLLGFDYYGEGGRTANWHSEYPPEWSQPSKNYSRFLDDFLYLERRTYGRIVNLNPNSNLRLFPFCTLDEVLT